MATCEISTISTKGIAFEKTTRRDRPEQSLVRRAQRGDEKAFATLFQLHKKRVYSVCLLMTKDVAEAEDLTQETFLQVFRSVGTFRGDAAFSTWLHRVAVNTVLMNLRHKSPPMLSLDQPVHRDSPSLQRDFGRNDPNLSGTIDRISLQRAIQGLSAGCRQIFCLYVVQGHPHQEIAQLLHCSVGNSKSQLHRAKMKMRDLLFAPRKGARYRDAGQQHSLRTNAGKARGQMQRG